MAELKTLPGFLLTIEDNPPISETQKAASDVITIYSIMPDTFKYEDEEGNIYDKYIEPNKPMLIVSKDEALKTLELSGINITREVSNIISLAPTDTNIAICKIVKRNGESPDKNNLMDMYEALDFAFEETENYPVRQVVLADISFDKSLANKPNEKFVEYLESSDPIIDKTSLLNLIGNVHKKGDADYVDKNTQFDLTVELKRDENSKEQLNRIGIYSDITFKINGKVAKCITNLEEGTEADMVFKIDTTYNPEAGEHETKYTINSLTSPTSNPANQIAAIGDGLQLTLGEKFILKIDEENVLEINQGVLEIDSLGQAETGEENLTVAEVHIAKNSSECHILLRALKFVHTITTTKNNCMLFLSPEPPRNQSNKAKTEYIEKLKGLYQAFTDIRTQTIKGLKIDLGMYLTVAVGANRYNNLGGLTGFPQITIQDISESTLTTKTTSYFSVGDNVEIYTYDKLDILTLSATVTEVKQNTDNTTTITVSKEIPQNIKDSKIPKYIMNVNNKDFNGNYMAMQWANVCIDAGLDRSPEGLAWNGECQLAFSNKELDTLNVMKYSVLDQITGTTSGAVSRSQLMTGANSQFQDIENLVTVYALTKGIKTIGEKYKGTRFDEVTDLALIRTELEDTVFKPGVGRYITSDYELKLFLKDLKEDSTGKNLRALYIDFTVTEIKTLKLLRIRAKVK